MPSKKLPQPDPLVDLAFPLKGLNEDTALAKAPQGFSTSLQNVRSYDQVSGRNRGAQRPGLGKYCPTALSASIQDIDHLAVSGGTGVYKYGIGTSYMPGSFGTAYFAILDNSGVAVSGYSSVLFNGPAVYDENGNLYVSFGILDSLGSLSSSPVYVVKYDSTGTVVWTWTYANTPGTSQPLGIDLSNGVLYLLVSRYYSAAPQLSQMFRVNAGTGSALDTGPWLSTTIGKAYQLSVSNSNLAVGATYIGVAYYNQTNSRPELFVINKSTGVVSTTVTIATATNGYDVADVAADTSDNFYVCWSSTNGGLSTTPDTLKAYTSAGATTWTKTGTRIFSVCYDRLQSTLVAVGSVVGTAATFVVQINPADGTEPASGAPGSHAWHCIRPDGRMGYRLSHTNGDVGQITAALALVWSVNLPSISGYSMACCSGQNIASAAAGVGQRVIRGIVVAGGTVSGYDTTGVVSVTSGTTALSTTRPVIFSAPNGPRLYFADGASTKRYNPITNAVEAWTPTTGSLPTDSAGNYATLIATWRGRTVVAGLVSDPQNWFMSRQNNPLDWNYAPSPVDAQQAVAGNNALAGQPSDIVNTMIPYSDDVLIFGCDHTIWKMTGDPMEGGRLDLLCDSIGMAWGQPWARDSKGGIYFASTRGSIYYLQPGAQPQKVSQAIDTRFIAINQATNIFRLAWDDRWQELHVFVTPVAAAAASTHYCFDAVNQAWFVDVFANNNHNPKAIHIYDGDAANDRVLILGGWDGYLRAMNPSYGTDDGTTITSYVYLGPIQFRGQMAFLLKELQCTLATGSASVAWSVVAAESVQAALAGSAVQSGTFSAGRSRSQLVRRRGHAAFVKLTGTAGFWALELLQMSAKMLPGQAERIF